MFDTTDPRAALATAAPRAVQLDPPGPADCIVLETDDQGGHDSYVRAQNFVVHYATVAAGTTLARAGQADEYVLILPGADDEVVVTTADETATLTGPRLVVVPPGDSTVTATRPGRLVRLLTAVSAPDLLPLAANDGSYDEPKPNVAPYQAWPAPVDGHRLRSYDLDVPAEPGRFGRIWRCSTFMVNFLDPVRGPRDPHKLSPHTHDDFEQCSLAMEGDFVHHLRWPWSNDRFTWRDDAHLAAPTPSVLVIPPPVLHTTEAVGAGTNQLVDIFCPPRDDFSRVEGWVLNHDEYPMPDAG